MRANIKIDNLGEVLRKINRWEKKTTKQVDDEIKKGALNIESVAKRRVPVDTGRLRSSLRSRLGKLSADVFTEVIYSKYIEFGTRFMRAQPFLFPAWEEERPKLIRRIKAILNKK